MMKNVHENRRLYENRNNSNHAKNRIFLTENDRGQVKINTTLRDAKKACESLAIFPFSARTNALPRYLFESLEEEEVLKIFEKNEAHKKDIFLCCWY